MTDVVRVGLLLQQQAFLPQVFDDQLARLDARQSVVAKAGDVHAAVEVHAVDDLEVMALPDVVVHRVVPGRDLERAGAEVRIHRLVSDDRQLAADQREGCRLADHVAVARVVGMHGDPGVGEHRLGTDRGDGHLASALNRVFDEVEDVVVLLPLDLQVGDGRLVVRAPVDDSRSPVDPAALVEGDERGEHRADVALVHSESLARPVEGRAEDPVLADDGGSDGAVPLVDQLSERVAAYLLFARAVLREPLLDHVLRGDGGMVGAGKEQDLVPGHAPVSGPDVLHGAVERVTHVQLARDVGGRQADRVTRLVALRRRREQPRLLPARVPAGLDGLWIERFGHIRRGGVLHR